MHNNRKPAATWMMDRVNAGIVQFEREEAALAEAWLKYLTEDTDERLRKTAILDEVRMTQAERMRIAAVERKASAERIKYFEDNAARSKSSAD